MVENTYLHSQCVQAECSHRMERGLAPRHFSSFIIHTAIYHTGTYTPAVHTNESLRRAKKKKHVQGAVQREQ